jgi:uncharacterized repeat protein (TIGR03809 family)
MSDEIIRKWHALAEKRRSHLVELYDSGRWTRYYSESEFVTQMRGAVELSDAWARLTDVPTQVAAE